MSYTNGLDDPTAYFQTALYNGNAGTQSIVNDGNSDLQPDMVWMKCRSGTHATENHRLQDSVRGAGKFAIPNGTTSIDSANTSSLTAFNSDGFSLGNVTDVNGSGAYVAWQWKAGTSFTNDASATGIGTIDSAGSASDTSGFSIVSYTGTGSAGTIKHGLSTAPLIILIKTASTTNWNFLTYQIDGSCDELALNLSSEGKTDRSITAPTSSVFSVDTAADRNGDGVNAIAYCFSERKGFSKFSTFKGNSSSDGTYIHLGFSPAFFLFKNSSSAGSWVLVDAKRPGFNVINDSLNTNNANAENTATVCDFTSNGVKFRTNADHMNGSYTFIYMAFAENPFVTSTGVPATAR